MEGKATFTLTRADSGRVIRQFTEHNLVTDAIRRLLSAGVCDLQAIQLVGFHEEFSADIQESLRRHHAAWEYP